MYNELGPNATFPYTYEGLCLAIDHYNEGHAEKIFMMGTDEEKKHELAAFLGHTLHESDEWKAGREYLICAGKHLSLTSGYVVYTICLICIRHHDLQIINKLGMKRTASHVMRTNLIGRLSNALVWEWPVVG
jgi:hypothetical protein